MRLNTEQATAVGAIHSAADTFLPGCWRALPVPVKRRFISVTGKRARSGQTGAGDGAGNRLTPQTIARFRERFNAPVEVLIPA